MINVKKEVSKNRKVRFSHYQHGILWYVTDGGFIFPVPVSDLEDAEVGAEEHAIMFMRWIKRYKDEIDRVESESARTGLTAEVV